MSVDDAAAAALPVVAEVPQSGGNFLLVRLRGAGQQLDDDVRNWLHEQHRIKVKDVCGRFPIVPIAFGSPYGCRSRTVGSSGPAMTSERLSGASASMRPARRCGHAESTNTRSGDVRG